MKKTKPILLLLSIAFFISHSYAQQVISSAGNYYQGDNLSMSWTLGETIIETFTGNDIILTQGFQQPYNFYYTQILNIPAGWSGASVYLDPLYKGIENLYADHASDFIIQSSLSDMYYPAANINTIGNWNYETGYQIKAENDFELKIIGSKITNPVVQLQMGWNLIPVLSACGASTMDVFGSMTNIEIAKEVAGVGVYWPQYNINSLETLSPGKAYLVRMNAENSFTYPACDKSNLKSEATKKPSYATPWNPLNYAATSHVIAIPQAVLLQSEIQIGDIIGIFTPRGICAGQARVDNTT